MSYPQFVNFIVWFYTVWIVVISTKNVRGRMLVLMIYHKCSHTMMLSISPWTMVKSPFVYFNDVTIVIRSTGNYLRRNTRWWSELIVMKQVPRSEYCHLKIRMSLYLIPICYETRDSLSLTESECPTGLVIPYFFIK